MINIHDTIRFMRKDSKKIVNVTMVSQTAEQRGLNIPGRMATSENSKMAIAREQSQAKSAADYGQKRMVTSSGPTAAEKDYKRVGGDAHALTQGKIMITSDKGPKGQLATHEAASRKHTEAAHLAREAGKDGTKAEKTALEGKAKEHLVAAAAHDASAKALGRSKQAFAAQKDANAHGDVDKSFTQNVHKMAGEQHLQAAAAHDAAGNKEQAETHRSIAADHAAASGGEWDEAKHPRGEGGKFGG